MSAPRQHNGSRAADAGDVPRVEGLDVLALGHHFFRLPIIADVMGHVSPEESLTYLHAQEGEREMEYMLDLLKMMQSSKAGRLDAFIDKWFGGKENAHKLVHQWREHT